MTFKPINAKSFKGTMVGLIYKLTLPLVPYKLIFNVLRLAINLLKIVVRNKALLSIIDIINNDHFQISLLFHLNYQFSQELT